MIPNITKRSRLTSDNWFALLAGVMLCHYTLFEYFVVIIGKLPVVSILENFFFPIVYFVLAFLSFKSSRFKWIRATDVLIVLLVVLAILVTIVFYPENAQYITEALLKSIFPCLPFFLLGLCLNLDEDTYKTISLLSCLAIIVNTLYLVYFLSDRSLTGSHGEDYSMYWSYLLLPNTLIAIDYSFKTKKIFAIICSVIGVIYAFGMGTRGAIVIIAAAIVVCIWRYSNLKTSTKIITFILLGIFVYIFISSSLYLQTLMGLKDVLAEHNMSTRVIDYLINGEMLSYTSDRDNIYIDLFNKLNERPVFGYGIYGEYSLGYLAGAHNIYLQVVFHFGYPLGIVLLMSYIVVFIRAIYKTKGTLVQGWIALFGCLVFVKGIFGGSWLDYSVFFLLGLCLKGIRTDTSLNLN